MSSIITSCLKRGLIKNYPIHIKDPLYEVIMGSYAYGVNSDMSDVDVYALCIPAKHIVFPHLNGYILGFGSQPEKFESFQQHHIADPDSKRDYDITVFSIVKYFDLCMNNNPNMIDSLFVPSRCVLHCTKIGEMIRDNRKVFLCKKAWHTFKGYSYAQMHKMDIKTPEGNRKESVDKYGYDVKYAYHIIRLMGEVEQILTEGDIDLERDRERLKEIRRGGWTIEQIRELFYSKEKSLEEVYNSSTLPHTPREKELKKLLINCLEEYYGSLKECVEKERNIDILIKDIQEVLSKYE
jgi:predicted nucleotidyltransferase